MSIQRIQPGKRLSAAVVHGDTIYIAGQIAGDALPHKPSRHSIAGFIMEHYANPRRAT